MEQTIQIYIKNNGQTIEVPIGSNLETIYQASGLEMKHGPISAHVNNKVEGMHYRAYKQKEVEFLDITSASGSRAYTRTLFFVLCKVAHELFDRCKVAIDIPVSNGYYVNLNIGRPVTLDDAGAIRRRMQEVVDAAMPIHRHETTTEEAITLFDSLHNHSKVKLLNPQDDFTRLTMTSMVMWITTMARCSPTRRNSTSSGWRNTTMVCCCACPHANILTNWAR